MLIGMEVTREQLTNAIVLTVSGQIDMYSSPELRGELKAAVKSKPDRIVVDMKEVSFVDSSGLATLIEALQQVKTYEGGLFLCNLNETVMGVFELSNLDKLFQIRADRDAALEESA